MKKKVIFAVVILAVAVVLCFNMFKTVDYSVAYKNNKSLENYTLEISTLVTATDGDKVRQTGIDQTVGVKDKGEDDMVYSVESRTTVLDETGAVTEGSNSYMYKDGYYYQSLPGVNYKSPMTGELALKNLVGIEDIILVPEEKMQNVMRDGHSYMFEIDFADASDHVNAVLESAVNSFQDVSFSKDEVYLTALVEGKYIKEQTFYLSYNGENGENITVEIYIDLIDTKADIAEIDESKFVNIVG